MVAAVTALFLYTVAAKISMPLMNSHNAAVSFHSLTSLSSSKRVGFPSVSPWRLLTHAGGAVSTACFLMVIPLSYRLIAFKIIRLRDFPKL